MTALSPVHGRLTQFTYNANDMSYAVNSVTFERDNDTHDITCFGATGHAYLAGLTDGKITVQGMWDKTATVSPQVNFSAAISDADGAAFVYGPEGPASGKVKYTGTAILESFTESSPVADMCTFTASLKITGAVTATTYP